MIRVFVDTSAFLAFLNPDDAANSKAVTAVRRLAVAEAALVTTSSVLVETYALLGRRMGLAAVRRFREEFESTLEIVWIDRELHERGLDLMLERNRSGLSLVDATSFVVIRDLAIDRVLAFDDDFERERFTKA